MKKLIEGLEESTVQKRDDLLQKWSGAEDKDRKLVTKKARELESEIDDFLYFIHSKISTRDVSAKELLPLNLYDELNRVGTQLQVLWGWLSR